MDSSAKSRCAGILRLVRRENYGKVSPMQKRYFIEDIEKELGVTRKTFYNWEQAGKVPKAKRDPMSNYRYWTESDLSKLKKRTGRV